MPVRPDNVATPYVSLDDWHFERWRGNILAKLGDATALDSLMVALDGTPAPFVHATASLHCDIAHRPQRRPPDGPAKRARQPGPKPGVLLGDTGRRSRDGRRPRGRPNTYG
jgi:hypothetical protein